MRMLNVVSVMVLGLGAWAGCSKDAGSGELEPGASQGSEEPPAPLTGTVPMTKLTDGQIARVVMTIDAAEVEQAEVALEKSKNPEVRAYATTLIEHHTASKQAGEEVASQAGLTPEESPKAINMEADGAQLLEALKAADPAAFDAIYLQGQIDQHMDALAVIDEQLQPAVISPALRDHLSRARGMVAQHLEQAKQLHGQLELGAPIQPASLE